jgi:hypothetical protein
MRFTTVRWSSQGLCMWRHTWDDVGDVRPSKGEVPSQAAVHSWVTDGGAHVRGDLGLSVDRRGAGLAIAHASAMNLCLKIHLSVTTLVIGGHGTKSHMLLDSMALYSSIAWRQWGSTSVLRTKVGTGDSVEEAVAASSPHTGPPVYHLVAVTRDPHSTHQMVTRQHGSPPSWTVCSSPPLLLCRCCL